MRPESTAGFQPRFQSLRTMTGLSVDDISRELGISLRTAYRYDNGTHEPRKPVMARLERLAQEYRHSARSGGKAGFTFIDLFAGIGGLRLGFEGAGGRCVFTSEWDKKCQETYRANFPDDHELAGDIRPFADDPSRIPAHDVLLAGFPCQPFSIAGVSKKNSLGRPHGFLDETQGTLFFETARIIRHHRPKAFILENVKNLAGHDRGRTFSTIMHVLTKELGYHVQYRIVSAEPWVPQKRERIFIVGFREKTDFDIGNLDIPDRGFWPKLGSILDPVVDPKYTLTPRLWQYLQDYKAKHNAAGNGFGYSLFGPDDVTRTLSARYYKDGSEILVDQGTMQRPRRLTPRECARLMGFDTPGREFRITVSDCQAYRQFGNAVVVPVARCIASAVVPHLHEGASLPVITKGDLRALARACA